jgi:hypothetical protein
LMLVFLEVDIFNLLFLIGIGLEAILEGPML